MLRAISSVCLVLITCVPVAKAGVTDWSYTGSHGPNNWYLDYPNCNGMTQSPINIDTSNVLYNKALEQFDLAEYSKTKNITMHLVNKGGHTAEVEYSGDVIRLQGGSLPDIYILSQFHFHWGSASRRGSEHTVNGQQYPMELHLVHYQSHFGNIANSVQQPSGLAVVGYFFKVGKHNANFDQLLRYFPQIKDSDQHVDIATFPLLDLLPSPKVNYFRYDGSLTTPPCFETVIWSLSTDPIEVAEEQLEVFRSLHDSSNHSLVDDFRPLQLLNQRTVQVSHMEFEIGGDSGSYVTSSAATIILLSLLSLWVTTKI